MSFSTSAPPEFENVKIRSNPATLDYDIVTSRLETPLGPRLLKSTEEDFPDKPHKGIASIAEAVVLAKWWDEWISRQNGPKKGSKK